MSTTRTSLVPFEDRQGGIYFMPLTPPATITSFSLSSHPSPPIIPRPQPLVEHICCCPLFVFDVKDFPNLISFCAASTVVPVVVALHDAPR